MRIVKPKMKCSNCKHFTRILNSQTGKYWCEQRQKWMNKEDYCTHYNME